MTGARVRISQIVLAVLALGYAVQAATPLRLHPDNVPLLAIAESAAHGTGFLFRGQPTVFPPGYPAVVAVLFRLGLAHSWELIAFNLFGLAGGFLALRYILARRFGATPLATLNVCIASLLSFVFIRYVAIPLTDPYFFGVAMAALALLVSAEGVEKRPFPGRVLAAWALVALAISIRRVGVALIPPLVWATVSRKELREWVRQRSAAAKAGGIAAAAGLAGATGWIVARTSTLRDFHSVLAGYGWWAAVRQIVGIRLTELGEMTANLPRFILPGTMQSALPWIGVALAGLVAAGMWMGGRWGTIEVFFASYAAVLFCWPFSDARFWLPVIPFLIVYLWRAANRWLRLEFLQAAGGAYVGVYAILGVLNLSLSTAVTFSGRNFPNVYQDGMYRDTYCTVFQSCAITTAPDPLIVHVYQTFR